MVVTTGSNHVVLISSAAIEKRKISVVMLLFSEHKHCLLLTQQSANIVLISLC